MAQPTLNSRPAEFAGTSLPMLYKFTSTNYSNAGYYMAVEIWDAIGAVKIADAKFYSNSSGAVWVDVSKYIESYISLNLTGDAVVSYGYLVDDNWLKYYIKYQEIWTASSESQVNDVANFRHAIYGGFQIGAINSYANYITSAYNFLRVSNSYQGYAAFNYPFAFSFWGIDNTIIRIRRYNVIGSLLSTVDADIIDDGIISYFALEANSSVAYYLVSIVGENDNGGSSTLNVTRNTGTTGTTSTFQDWYLKTGTTPTELYSYSLSVAGSPGAEATVRLIYTYFDGTTETVATHTRTSDGSSSGNNITFPTPTKTVIGFNLQASTTIGGSPAVSASITASVLTSGFVTLTENDYRVNILPECQNIVNTVWRNYLGGWETYPFSENQELTWHYSNRVAKRKTLYADSLPLENWEVINGLNTIGENYRVNITEALTTTVKTMSTIGQSVYTIDQDGSRTGVTVIQSPNTTKTRAKKHNAVITIELPEQILQ